MKYVKKLTIYLMAFFYAYAGINHFINPDYFLSIMPPYFPWQLEAVYISGFFEIIFGISVNFLSYWAHSHTSSENVNS